MRIEIFVSHAYGCLPIKKLIELVLK